MKIIQILQTANKSLLGLGEDGKLYIMEFDIRGNVVWTLFKRGL